MRPTKLLKFNRRINHPLDFMVVWQRRLSVARYIIMRGNDYVETFIEDGKNVAMVTDDWQDARVFRSKRNAECTLKNLCDKKYRLRVVDGFKFLDV